MEQSGKMNDEILREDIQKALICAQNGLSSFRTAIANKHVIILLGNTRSGKSTLVNYIIGTKLIAFEERLPIYKIKKANDKADGPIIGQGVQSCTSMPGIYPLNQYGMIIIDAPGFDDNRSEAQDIVNALYINQVRYAKTVKFMLVSDINDLISDNIKGFVDLITNIYTIVPNFQNLKKSVSIVFTKDHRQYSQWDVASLLKQKVLDVDGLLINRELISYFVKNPDYLALFRMPTQAGELTSSIDVNIEHARVTSCAVILEERDIKVALSAKSRLILVKIYQRYLDTAYFEKQVKQIIINFTEYFDVEDYVFASLTDELNDLKQNLNCISTLFETELNINRNMTNLCDIKNSLIRIFQRNILQEFSKTFNTLVMIDNALLMEDAIKEKFVTKYKECLKEQLEKIKKLRNKIDDELEDRETNRTLFRASAGVTGTAATATVVGEVLHRVIAGGSRAGSPFGLLGIVGGLISAVGAGVATTSYMVEKERQKKRIEARKAQGRIVHHKMFEDDLNIYD